MDALIASSSKGGEDEVVFRMPKQICKTIICLLLCVPINLCEATTLSDGQFTTTTRAAYLLYQRDETDDHQIPIQQQPRP